MLVLVSMESVGFNIDLSFAAVKYLYSFDAENAAYCFYRGLLIRQNASGNIALHGGTGKTILPSSASLIQRSCSCCVGCCDATCQSNLEACQQLTRQRF